MLSLCLMLLPIRLDSAVSFFSPPNNHLNNCRPAAGCFPERRGASQSQVPWMRRGRSSAPPQLPPRLWPRHPVQCAAARRQGAAGGLGVAVAAAGGARGGCRRAPRAAEPRGVVPLVCAPAQPAAGRAPPGAGRPLAAARLRALPRRWAHCAVPALLACARLCSVPAAAARGALGGGRGGVAAGRDQAAHRGGQPGPLLCVGKILVGAWYYGL